MRPSYPRAALTEVIEALTALDAFVLRNPHLFDNLDRGGDWDILVGDLGSAERVLVRYLGPPDGLVRRSYVSSYFYSWGYIDLFENWQWRGVPLLRNAHLRRAVRPGPSGMPRLDPATESVVLWFSKLLWNGAGDPRYAAAILQASRDDPRAFHDACRLLVGRSTADQLLDVARRGELAAADDLVGSIRRQVTRRAATRQPMRTALGRLQFVIAEARLRRRPPVPTVAVRGRAEVADVVEAAADSSWSAVTGAVRVSVPSSATPLRFAIHYWLRLVQHRTRCKIVVFEIPENSTSWPRLVPQADLSLGAGDANIGELGTWMINWTRRRAAGQLFPTRATRPRIGSRR